MIEKSVESIDQVDFEITLTRFKEFVQTNFPEFGRNFVLENKWEEDRVRAYATKDIEDNPVIVVYGGMARHPQMNTDGLYAILCHELGHFLGGSPQKTRGPQRLKTWSATEGQADYFATSKCLKILFKDEIAPPGIVDSELNQVCSNALCKRIGQASLVVAKVFAQVQWVSEVPSVLKHDSSVVGKTMEKHPSPQCRLDTMIAGLKCPVSESIPFSSVDPEQGACHRFQTDSTLKANARPTCWYLPIKK